MIYKLFSCFPKISEVGYYASKQIESVVSCFIRLIYLSILWFLHNLKKNGEIDNIIYDKIYPAGSQPVRIHGLPKMHKVQDHSLTPLLKPIVSLIGTFNYNIALSIYVHF